MKTNLLRSAAAILMLLCLALVISSPAIAEVAPLDLDQLTVGNPALESGWNEDATEYTDPSIHVTVEHSTAHKVKTSIVRITISDPSQLRTAMSEDSYDKTAYVKAAALAKHVNAIAAVNGDFFKYYDFGYLVRQGVLYRDLPGAGKYLRDMLVIDDQGDFYAVKDADADNVKDFLANTLPADRTVINTFTLGPVLVVDGAVQEITTREFQYRYKMQRVAIVQVDALSYAIVECDGKADASSGMSLSTFAEYIQSLFPNCRMAYNLDGGGSTNVIVNNKRIHKNPDSREICDILYFASAYTED